MGGAGPAMDAPASRTLYSKRLVRSCGMDPDHTDDSRSANRLAVRAASGAHRHRALGAGAGSRSAHPGEGYRHPDAVCAARPASAVRDGAQASAVCCADADGDEHRSSAGTGTLALEGARCLAHATGSRSGNGRVVRTLAAAGARLPAAGAPGGLRTDCSASGRRRRPAARCARNEPHLTEPDGPRSTESLAGSSRADRRMRRSICRCCAPLEQYLDC